VLGCWGAWDVVGTVAGVGLRILRGKAQY
jgi:hypothetical protein